jgi:hypothetical protein
MAERSNERATPVKREESQSERRCRASAASTAKAKPADAYDSKFDILRPQEAGVSHEASIPLGDRLRRVEPLHLGRDRAEDCTPEPPCFRAVRPLITSDLPFRPRKRRG